MRPIPSLELTGVNIWMVVLAHGKDMARQDIQFSERVTAIIVGILFIVATAFLFIFKGFNPVMDSEDAPRNSNHFS
jgi:hypothetical protein